MIDVRTINGINDTLNEARMISMDKECGEEKLRNMCWRLSILLANVTGTLVGMENMIEEVMPYCANDVMLTEHMREEGHRNDG